MKHLSLTQSAVMFLALSCGFAAQADVVITIDPAAHCLDTDTMVGGKAIGSLPPGTYQASVVDNSMRCGGDRGKRCAMNTVIARVIDFAAKPGTLLWGGAIGEKPSTVKVLGTDSAALSAFVLDNGCSDNLGSATLIFQSIP